MFSRPRALRIAFGERMDAAKPEELLRTEPDLVVHDPTDGHPRNWDDPGFFWLNEQLLVVGTGDGGLLATWTSERLDPHLLRVACSRSGNGGRTWSPAHYVDGDGIGAGGSAAWQVPVTAPSGRLYLLYTHSPRPGAGAFCGGLRCRTSDDHGRSWSLPADLAFPGSPIDSPEAGQTSVWISVSVPVYTAHGCALLGFTRWAANPAVTCGACGIKERHSQVEFLRFGNLGQCPDAGSVKLTALNVEDPITVPHEGFPEASFAQEPYTVNLPDGRLFTAIRTNRGGVWYAVSEDEAVSWSEPRPLLYQDGGEAVRHPVAPCPVFALGLGGYLLLFHDNDGYVFGAESRWDVRNRRPTFAFRGRFQPAAEQPIWWGRPQLLIDNAGVPWGPAGMGRLESAAYPSMTQTAGGRILWYPDRKGFLLGKSLSDDWLATLDVPGT